MQCTARADNKYQRLEAKAKINVFFLSTENLLSTIWFVHSDKLGSDMNSNYVSNTRFNRNTKKQTNDTIQMNALIDVDMNLSYF